MTLRTSLRSLLISALALNACIPLEDDGGGGGVGPITFSAGYVFVRPDTRDLYVANASDTQSVMALTRDGGNRHPALSPDGKSAVYVHVEAGTTSLRRVAVQSGATSSVLLDSDGTYGGFRYPVFSPDGSTVAFTFEQGGVARVGTVQVDGSGFTQVSPQGSLAYGAPSWMPDGSALVVPAGNSLGNLTQVESLQLSTGQPTTLRSSLGNEALSIVNRVVVSPDGQAVAFDARVASNVTRIFTAPLSGGQVTQVTDHAGQDAFANDSFPTFLSPTQLAFGSDAGGADQVYEVTLPATKQAGVLRVPTAAEPFYGAVK
ncbi:MAG: hypothetical protein RL653_1321 [Pseudomonadota bacterium]|jgi:TolB protein